MAAVVGLEILGELRQRGVAYEDFEIVIGAGGVLGAREVAAPFPFLYRTRGDGVARQNQVLIPDPGLASTTTEGVERLQFRPADGYYVGSSRGRPQRQQRVSDYKRPH
jgi:hypothetical protein